MGEKKQSQFVLPRFRVPCWLFVRVLLDILDAMRERRFRRGPGNWATTQFGPAAKCMRMRNDIIWLVVSKRRMRSLIYNGECSKERRKPNRRKKRRRTKKTYNLFPNQTKRTYVIKPQCFQRVERRQTRGKLSCLAKDDNIIMV